MTAYTATLAEVDNVREPIPQAPRLFLWTVEQYLSLIEDGILTEEDKTELLAGNIIAKMASNKPRDAVISFVQDYFIEKYFKEHTMRSERAIRLSEDSMPEPDYVVALYREDKYRSAWPTVPDVLLLIEVSDSTLSIDRGIKKTLYASAGIKEYWIINIPGKQIEVHLKPDTEAGTYGKVDHYKQEETFESPFAGEVKVTDLLPL